MNVTMRIASLVCLLIIGAEPCFAFPSDGRPDAWWTDYSAAQTEARRRGIPLLVHFYAEWCGPCHQMEREVLHSSALMSQFGKSFVAVKIDSDKNPQLVSQYKIRSLPSDVLVTPEGIPFQRMEGYRGRRDYLARLSRAQTQYAKYRRFRIAKNRQSSGSPSQAGPGFPEFSADGGDVHSPRKAPVNTTPVKKPDWAIGLNGFSPVSLLRQHRWVPGRKQFAWEYQGIVYYMAHAEEFTEFQTDPARYAPRLLGCDPVVLKESERAVPGKTRFAGFYDGELFLFTSEANRQRFKKNPLQFTRTRHVLHIDHINAAVIR